MCVLIEGLTMVVRKYDLDTRYPGGTDTFLAEAIEPDPGPRFACNTDEHRVNVGYYTPEELADALALLRAQWFADAEEGRVADIAFVDQHFGPSLPCD
jgi:hypothetical protein